MSEQKRAPKRKPRTCRVWVAVSPNDGTFYLNTVSLSRAGAKHWQQVVNSGAGVLQRATLTLTGKGKGKEGR